MESSTSQDVHNVKDIVQQYLHDAESSPSGLEERSHLAQLCSECILLFQVILKTLPSNSNSVSKELKTMSISLKRSYGRMKIWADETGAKDGSLDATLATSPYLRRDVLKYIVSISQTLSERLVNFLDINLGETGLEAISAVRSLTTALTEGDSDSSSDSGFSDSSSCSVKGVLEDLRVDTTCLQDLEPLLSSPVLRTDPEPTALLDTTRMTWSPHQHYSDKISARFPMAADELVTKLGKANYERYLRCQKQKAANELRDTLSNKTASAVPDSASSKFHDSGIGSSLPTTASAYAETVMSYGKGEGRRIRVPPLPAEAKQGLPFACVACGKCVKIATNRAWKQHVYEDLEPWVCLEGDCVFDSDTFPTRKDWTNHLALDHGMDPEWPVTVCPLCRVDIGPGKVSITRHMVEHLEEISLSALPADCEFDEESVGDETDRGDDNDRYICQTCNKAFSRPSSLRIHSHSHTGEKPFKCPHAGCGKAFSVRSNLKRHERGFHSKESEDVTTHPEVLGDQITLGTESLSTTTDERKISTLDILQDKDGVRVPQTRREPVPREVITRNEYPDSPWDAMGLSTNKSGSYPHTAAGSVGNSRWDIGGRESIDPGTRRPSSANTEHPTISNANVPSSYWSVAEMNHFPGLLRRFGTDWEGIASHMTTKTATMVRNFYIKQTGTEKPEWRQIAFEADMEPQGERMPHVPSRTALQDHQRQEIKQQIAAAETRTQAPMAQEVANPTQQQLTAYNWQAQPHIERAAMESRWTADMSKANAVLQAGDGSEVSGANRPPDTDSGYSSMPSNNGRDADESFATILRPGMYNWDHAPHNRSYVGSSHISTTTQEDIANSKEFAAVHGHVDHGCLQGYCDHDPLLYGNTSLTRRDDSLLLNLSLPSPEGEAREPLNMWDYTNLDAEFLEYSEFKPLE